MDHGAGGRGNGFLNGCDRLKTSAMRKGGVTHQCPKILDKKSRLRSF